MKTIGKRTLSWMSVFSLLLTMIAVCGLTLPTVSAAETVYFSENFDSYANGTLPTNWTISSDSGIKDITVQDGGLVINGLGSDSQTRVLYTGSELASKGDYIFEADYTILQSDYALSVSTRWTGMIFRANTTTLEPYYYATTRVRTTTTQNELSIRNSASSMLKIDQAAQPVDLALNTTYHLKVVCSGANVKFYFDDALVFNTALDTTGAAYKYLTTGTIGFTTSNLKIKLDNISVKEFVGTITTQPTLYDTYIPDTNIVNPPSVITNVTSEEVYASVTGTKLPSTTLYYLNSDLDITTPDGGTVIANLTNALNFTNGKVIPALYIRDYATADALATYATEAALKDAFLVADDGALLKYARNKMSSMYGVLYTKLTKAATKDDLAAMYANTNKAWAKTVMVDAEYISKDDVEYLQKRLMNVWVIGEMTAEDKYENIYKGVNGIVDTDHASTLWIYENTSGVFNSATDSTPIIIRSPFLYAHRGYSSYANQNTMEAFYGAVLYGADLIEMDVRLTSDGVVVIYHDNYLYTLTNCTDTTKSVENTTYAELMTYEVDEKAGVGYPNGKIATLREFLELIDQTDDVVGIIEIKNYDNNLVDMSAAIVKEMGMEDQVVSICFGDHLCNRMRTQLPEVSVGWLANPAYDYKTAQGTVGYAKGFIMNYNLSYHPSYGQIQDHLVVNSMVKDSVAFAAQRGISFNPWTYNDRINFDTAYVGGIQGITTDYLEYDNNCVRRIDAGYRYELKEGVATALQGVGYISNEKKLYGAIFKRTGGADITFTNANGMVTASGTGMATGVLMYKSTTETAGSYYVVSGLTAVNVSANGGTTPTINQRESLLPPFVERWENSIKDHNIKVTREERGEVLTVTSGAWPAVTYTINDTATNNSISGVTASLNDSIAIDAIVGDRIGIGVFLSDGTNYALQKYISGSFNGDDLVGNGSRIRATVKLSDMIPASSATNGNVTITAIRIFNVGSAGTEIVIKALDLVREVPALYGLVGDVNSDGEVSTADARIIIGLTIGKGDVTYKEEERADFNKDSIVDSSDARVLLKSFVK